MIETPLIDRWRGRLGKRLTEYGAKAELARHLAGLYGGEQRHWERQIQNTLKRHAPSGELVLAINQWLERH
jgi:hypothetical protein